MIWLLSCWLLAAAVEPAPPAGEPHLEVVRAREAETLERVRLLDPQRHAELLALRDQDPRAYWRTLLRIAFLTEHERPDPPAVHEQEARLQALQARYPRGLTGLAPDQLTAVRAELTDIATRIFEARQAERRRKIDELRLALAGLEAEVSSRDANRDLLIRTWVDRQLDGPSAP